MAKGMRDIKRQIKSVQNTKQITKAMEMIAASKLRKAQASAEAARPYAEKIHEVVASIAAGSKGIKHPMLLNREVKKTGYLVITSDRGLAGGFNANLLRKVMNTIRANHKSSSEYAIFVIGRKGRDFFKKRNIEIIEEVTGLTDNPLSFLILNRLLLRQCVILKLGSYDELYLVYNQFINALSQVPVEKRLLPLAQETVQAAAVTNYEYEPSPEGVLEVLLPKYAETIIYSAVLESKASEFGARMTAMGSATKNATKMIILVDA